MGISINDVQRKIGSNSNNLGYLCTSDYINPWSKYKPVTDKDPIMNIKDSGKFIGENRGNIQFVHASSIADAVSKLNQDKTAKYIKIPSNYPKRLGDFQNYSATAEQPWIPPIDKVLSRTNNSANVLYLKKDTVYDGFNIMYKDIYPDYKLGGLVVNSNGQFDCLISNVNTLSQPNSQTYNLIPNHSHWDKKMNYTIYSVLISQPFPYTFEFNANNIKCNDIVLLPLNSYSMKFIQSDQLNIKLTITNADSAKGSYCFDVTYTNKSSKDYDCQFIKFEIIEEEWDEELQDTISSISDSWQEDLTGWVMKDGEVDADFRVGGCLNIKNYRPQATYYMVAKLRLMNNIDDITSAKELIV